MSRFAVDVVCVLLGVMIFGLGMSVAYADPSLKHHCDQKTNNPFSQTACIIDATFK